MRPLQAAARPLSKELRCQCEKHAVKMAIDLKVTGGIQFGYEASVKTWKIDLDNVADLRTKFMNFFHDL